MAETSIQYNARLSKPEAIAKTFVKHPEFESISQNRSKILVGPRGVGKTTILKLLTASGIHHLRRRNEFKDFGVDYLPLYIPADTLWKGEAASIEDAFAKYDHPKMEHLGHFLQNALFVDYCFYEVISSFQSAIQHRDVFNTEIQLRDWNLDVSREVEAAICENLSEAWLLDRPQRSFLGLKLALNERQNKNSSFISGLVRPSPKELNTQDSLNFFVKIKSFFDIVEHYTGVNSWGIHFDEMEIAPKAILSTVYQNLRSFDQRAILKFSLFPYADFLNMSFLETASRSDPQEGPDFDAVVLSGRFRQDNRDFPIKLVRQLCENRSIEFDDLVEYINRAVTTKAVSFSPGGHRIRNYGSLFSALREKDESFEEFLSERKIVVADIPSMSNTQQAENVRKIAPLVEFRNVYLRSLRYTKDGSFQVQKAPRKSYSYFFGFDRILQITEQNPRAVNFYFDSLISAFVAGRSIKPETNAIIRVNTDRFRALYATQTVPYDPLRGKLFNIIDFVDTFGNEVNSRLLEQKFSERPITTFSATNKIDDHIRKLLGIAINSGALVADVEGGQNRLLKDLTNVRFRISYQLAPYYPIPILLGETRRFSNFSLEANQQPDLLSWNVND